MNEEINNKSYDSLIRIKQFEFLRQIISSGNKNLNDFIANLLQEILKFTESRYGFVFRYSDNSEKFKLQYHYGETPPGCLWQNSESNYKPDCSGRWISAFDQNKAFICNSSSEFLFTTPERTVDIEVERFCSIPVIINKDFKICVVAAGKVSDYTFFENQLEYLVVEPATSIIVNLLTINGLRRSKDVSQEQENKRSNFVTNIAHEIKTPLNALAGFSRLLKEPELSVKNRQKFLDIIIESSDNLINIISHFSEVWEVETGKVNLAYCDINLDRLTDELFERFDVEAKKKKLIFEKQLTASGNNIYIVSDEEKLVNILEALLSNAFKYTFSGKIIFGFNVKDGEIEFFVSDTGVGITVENKSKIFDYSFAGNSLIKTFNGSGLGLYISKAYIEKLGGRIRVESSEGKGSVFYFTIPRKQNIEYSYDHKVKSGIKHPVGRIKKTILVAEDDNLNYFLIKNFLSGLNVNLIRAENGKEAVDLYAANKIDLVLMDIRMPEMDGYTAARIIKNSNPLQIIIAQTAYSNDRSVAIKNGCDDFIAKPFDKQQIVSLVENYLT